jgi:threonine synthase
MVRQRMIDPDEVVVVNCSGHTFPVEKHILGDSLIHDVDVTPVTQPSIPHEGLLAALETIDKNAARVLVIEDDSGAAQLMMRILKAHGIAETFHAADGTTGIQQALALHPDLIVLDLMMPGVDGFGVLDALKSDELLQHVPVVVVTAKDLTPEERSYLSGRVQSLLQKGAFLDDDELQALIEKNLN